MVDLLLGAGSSGSIMSHIDAAYKATMGDRTTELTVGGAGRDGDGRRDQRPGVGRALDLEPPVERGEPVPEALQAAARRRVLFADPLAGERPRTDVGSATEAHSRAGRRDRQWR
jgi:hypothetical protein